MAPGTADHEADAPESAKGARAGREESLVKPLRAVTDLMATLLAAPATPLGASTEALEGVADAYARVLAFAVEHVPGTQAAALSAPTAEGTWVYVAAHGFDLAPALAPGDSVPELRPGAPRTRLVRHAGSDDQGAPTPPALRGRVAATLSVPVRVAGELRNYLDLYSLDDDGAFAESAPAWGELVAAQLGALLQRLAFEASLRAAQARLEHEATHDPLTGLPNRSLLCDRLAATLARDRRDGRSTALFVIDPGPTAHLVQRLGHAGRDALWSASADGMRAALRDGDTVARCGSDALAVVAGNLRGDVAAHSIASKLQHALTEALAGVAPGSPPQAVIGVSLAPDDGATSAELLRSAEAARDLARQRGAPAVAFHAAPVDAAARTRERARALLVAALEGGRLRVRYQSVERLGDRRLVALRLLADVADLTPDGDLDDAGVARWNGHALVALADDARCEEALFTALLETASTDLCRWRDAAPKHPWRVILPLSPRLLRDGRAERIARDLSERHDLATGAIAWALAADRVGGVTPSLLRALASARRAGFDLLVDDVNGEGLAMRVLAELPLAGMTLAPATVRGLGTDQRDDAMAAALASLAAVLRLPLAAVDVAEASTLERLEALGCTHASGPSVAPAMTADEVSALVTDTAGAASFGDAFKNPE